MSKAVSDLATLKPIDVDAVDRALSVDAAIEDRAKLETGQSAFDDDFADGISDRLGAASSAAAKDVSARLSNHRNQAAKFCEGLDFEKEKNKIRALQNAIRVEIRRDEDNLVYAFELYQRARQYFDAYRERRSLVRPAKHGEAFGTLVAFLAIIAIIEAFFNAIFLAPVDPAGLVWGWLTSVLISIVNVGFGFAVGNGAKLFNSIALHAKALGAAIATIGFPALLAFHYLVMKYRAEMSLLGEEIEEGADYIGLSELFQRTWDSIVRNPFDVGDMISLIVFFVGIGVAVLAVRKGYTVGDPHPGYTSAQQQFEAHRTDFIEQRNEHLDALQDLRDEVIDEIDTFIKEAETGKTKALNYALNSQNLLQSYTAFRDSIDATANELIERYVSPLKGRSKTAVRKRLKERVHSSITHASDFEARVEEICELAKEGSEDARAARQNADDLRTETIAAIDQQIADFKEKFDR